MKTITTVSILFLTMKRMNFGLPSDGICLTASDSLDLKGLFTWISYETPLNVKP